MVKQIVQQHLHCGSRIHEAYEDSDIGSVTTIDVLAYREANSRRPTKKDKMVKPSRQKWKEKPNSVNEIEDTKKRHILGA